MKNIINEKPSEELDGRLLTAIQFVEESSILQKRILDIGCGYGWFEMYCINKGCKHITGCEPTDNDLSTIRTNLKNDKLSTVVASATHLPFDDDSFDTVVVWEVIEHIPLLTEKLMFQEIHRVLVTGGKLYLSTPYRNVFAMIFDPAWWLVNHRHYSKDMLEKFGNQVGLKLDKVKVTGKWWLILDILNMYFSKWVLRRSKLFKDFFDKKVNQEYSIDNGWVNIFVSYYKK